MGNTSAGQSCDSPPVTDKLGGQNGMGDALTPTGELGLSVSANEIFGVREDEVCHKSKAGFGQVGAQRSSYKPSQSPYVLFVPSSFATPIPAKQIKRPRRPVLILPKPTIPALGAASGPSSTQTSPTDGKSHHSSSTENSARTKPRKRPRISSPDEAAKRIRRKRRKAEDTCSKNELHRREKKQKIMKTYSKIVLPQEGKIYSSGHSEKSKKRKKKRKKRKAKHRRKAEHTSSNFEPPRGGKKKGEDVFSSVKDIKGGRQKHKHISSNINPPQIGNKNEANVDPPQGGNKKEANVNSSSVSSKAAKKKYFTCGICRAVYKSCELCVKHVLDVHSFNPLIKHIKQTVLSSQNLQKPVAPKSFSENSQIMPPASSGDRAKKMGEKISLRDLQAERPTSSLYSHETLAPSVGRNHQAECTTSPHSCKAIPPAPSVGRTESRENLSSGSKNNKKDLCADMAIKVKPQLSTESDHQVDLPPAGSSCETRGEHVEIVNQTSQKKEHQRKSCKKKKEKRRKSMQKNSSRKRRKESKAKQCDKQTSSGHSKRRLKRKYRLKSEFPFGQYDRDNVDLARNEKQTELSKIRQWRKRSREKHKSPDLLSVVVCPTCKEGFTSYQKYSDHTETTHRRSAAELPGRMIQVAVQSDSRDFLKVKSQNFSWDVGASFPDIPTDVALEGTTCFAIKGTKHPKVATNSGVEGLVCIPTKQVRDHGDNSAVESPMCVSLRSVEEHCQDLKRDSPPNTTKGQITKGVTEKSADTVNGDCVRVTHSTEGESVNDIVPQQIANERNSDANVPDQDDTTTNSNTEAVQNTTSKLDPMKQLRQSKNTAFSFDVITCFPCKKTFNTFQEYYTHRQSEHKPVEVQLLSSWGTHKGKHVCKVCGDGFSELKEVLIHTAKHKTRGDIGKPSRGIIRIPHVRFESVRSKNRKGSSHEMLDRVAELVKMRLDILKEMESQKQSSAKENQSPASGLKLKLNIQRESRRGSIRLRTSVHSQDELLTAEHLRSSDCESTQPVKKNELFNIMEGSLASTGKILGTASTKKSDPECQGCNRDSSLVEYANKPICDSKRKRILLLPEAAKKQTLLTMLSVLPSPSRAETKEHNVDGKSLGEMSTTPQSEVQQRKMSLEKNPIHCSVQSPAQKESRTNLIHSTAQRPAPQEESGRNLIHSTAQRPAPQEESGRKLIRFSVQRPGSQSCGD